MRSLDEHGYVGANVTLPHKLVALEAADIADEAARAIGAANTLWLDGEGRLNASNTDAYGFMTNLAEQAPNWNEGRRPVVRARRGRRRARRALRSDRGRRVQGAARQSKPRAG